MSESQTFSATASATVDAEMHDIWAVWVDVNAWKTWNDDVDSTEMHGNNFKVGNSFTLRPQGGEPVEVTITSVTQGEEFTDETTLPFGVVRNYHRMEALGSRVRITHEVEAVIDSSQEKLFASKIWPGMQSGVSSAVLNIADLVGND